jgi:hypothetical protein
MTLLVCNIVWLMITCFGACRGVLACSRYAFIYILFSHIPQFLGPIALRYFSHPYLTGTRTPLTVLTAPLCYEDTGSSCQWHGA